jgi:hypothetical protein
MRALVRTRTTVPRHSRTCALGLLLALALTGCVGGGGGGIGAAPGIRDATVTVPASIAGDCSRDVTGELQAWVNATPDGSLLQLTPNACYRLDGTLEFRDRHRLTFDGRRALFWAMTDGRQFAPRQARTRSQFRFAYGNDIVVRDVIVHGANPNAGTGDAAYVSDLEAQHGFEIGGTTNMLLDRVQVTDVYGDFVYVGAPSSQITVQNSTFTRNGRQGWTVSGGEDITFAHNSISETRRATIDMEANSTSATTRRITFSDNVIGAGRLFLLSQHGATAISEDVAFLRNRLVGKSMTIHVEGDPGYRSRYRVIGNTSDAPQSQEGGGVIYFAGVAGAEVRDNTQPVQVGRGISGVGLRASRNLEITGNRFPDAIAPVFLDAGNTSIHSVDNLIGNPLRLAPETTIP